jgi:hypothetical protein
VTNISVSRPNSPPERTVTNHAFHELHLLRDAVPNSNLAAQSVYMRNQQLSGRRPRHEAASAMEVVVEIERAAGALPAVVAAELLDLSRRGVRLGSAVALSEGEPLTICLRAAEAALDLPLTGVVRWRKQEASNRWLYGCEFKEELPLETLGEFFLCGILSTQSPAPSGPDIGA